MQRSIHLHRSPLSKLFALRAKVRAIKPEPPAARSKPGSAGPSGPMAERLSRSPEVRITSWI